MFGARRAHYGHSWAVAVPRRRPSLPFALPAPRRIGAIGGTLLVHLLMLALLIDWVAAPVRFVRPAATITMVGIDGTQAEGTELSPDDTPKQVAPRASAEVVEVPTALPSTATLTAAPIVSEADAATPGAAPQAADSASSAGAGYDPYAGAAPLPIALAECHVRLHLPADVPCPEEDKASDGPGE